MPNKKLAAIDYLQSGFFFRVNELSRGVYIIIIDNKEKAKILIPEIPKLGSAAQKDVFINLNTFLSSNFDESNIPSSIILENDIITGNGKVLATKENGEWIGNKSAIELIKGPQYFYDFYTRNITEMNEGMNSNKTYGIRLTQMPMTSPYRINSDLINKYINIDLSSYDGSNDEKQKLIQQHIKVVKNAISNSFFSLEEMPQRIVIKNNPSDSTIPYVVNEDRDIYLSKKPNGNYVFEKIDFAKHVDSLSKEYQRLSLIESKDVKLNNEFESVKRLYNLMSEYKKQSADVPEATVSRKRTDYPLDYMANNLEHDLLRGVKNKVINKLLNDLNFYKEKIINAKHVTDESFKYDAKESYQKSGVDGKDDLSLFEFERKLSVTKSVIDQVKADPKMIDKLIKSHRNELAPFFSKSNDRIYKSLIRKTATDREFNSGFDVYIDKVKKDFDLSFKRNWVKDVYNNEGKFSSRLVAKLTEVYPIIYKPVTDWSLPTETVNINEYATVTKSNYDFQIIFQLRDDKLVADSAVKLAGKHHQGATSVIVQLSGDGSYHTLGVDPATGNFKLLEEHAVIDLLKKRVNSGKAKLRWQLVGHGNGTEDKQSTTLAGQQPGKLAKNLSKVYRDLQQHQVDIKPQQISLVGCNLAGLADAPSSFAYQFTEAMKDNGIKSTVSATTKAITVDKEGHKSVVTVKKNNSLVIKNAKISFKWNEQGKVEYQYNDKKKFEHHKEINQVNSLSDSNLSKPQPESSPSITK
ncbi:C80 family cysteine peptidase, partial [Yersinia sp. Marseille-Q3913]|uniref:C80 family cysteine peptidase n=1 Tax=Yersinia sp. Marseille-Q3913 TaxID=2830769 RepID=UPI001BBE0EEF